MIPIIIMAIECDDERDFMIKLYTDYQALMRKHAKNILNDQSLVEDIVQEVCVRLIKNIDTLMTLKCWALPSYIVFTTRSAVFDYINSKKTKDERDVAEIDEIIADNSVNVEAEVLSKYELQEVMSAMKKLPEKYRDVLNYKYFLDMTNNEIAETIHIQPDSVYMYIIRARRKLLELLETEDE